MGIWNGCPALGPLCCLGKSPVLPHESLASLQESLDNLIMEGDNIVSAARKAIIRHDYSAVLTIFPILKHLKQMKPEFDQVLQVNVMGLERVLWLGLFGELFEMDYHSGFEQSHAASVLQHGLEVTQIQLAPFCGGEPATQHLSAATLFSSSPDPDGPPQHLPFLPGECGISSVVDGAVNILLARGELRMRCWGEG